MRTFALIMVLTLMTIPANAQFRISEQAGCFSRVEEELRLGDTITVYTDTGTIRGVYPIVTASSSRLHMKPLSYSSNTDLVIPLEDVRGIKYTRPDALGTELGIAGFVAGTIGGALMGASLGSDREPTGSFDFSWRLSKTAWAVIGGAVGALFGTIVGAEIGGTIDRTVTLRCD